MVEHAPASDTGIGRATSVVAVFRADRPTAAGAVARVEAALAERGIRSLAAAVAVLEDRDGRTRLVVEPADVSRASSASAIAELFPAWVLALNCVGRQADAASVHFHALGCEVNLLRELGENISPAGAAILFIVEEPWLADIAEVIAPVGILRCSLQADAQSLSPGAT